MEFLTTAIQNKTSHCSCTDFWPKLHKTITSHPDYTTIQKQLTTTVEKKMDFSPKLHRCEGFLITTVQNKITIPTQHLDFSPRPHGLFTKTTPTKGTSHLTEVVVAQTVGKIQIGRLSRDRIPPSSRVKPYIHGAPAAWCARSTAWFTIQALREGWRRNRAKRCWWEDTAGATMMEGGRGAQVKFRYPSSTPGWAASFLRKPG